MFTSGTTGESKGVLSSYFHLYTVAEVLHGHMTSGDRILVNAPLFHVGGTGAITAALIHRGSVTLVDSFKATEFWQLIERTGCTMTSGLLGSMAPYLAKFGSPADRSSNRLRRTHFYPVSDETIALARAFDFEYYSGYGMTELPLVLVTDLNTVQTGSCGQPRSGVECRLVDAHDQEVPAGCAGELIVRTDHPWSFFSGYDGMPEATLSAWRNGWFHTGDLLRKGTDGNYYFVDRLKDSIRRRGENISSQEVEDAIKRHPDVADAAAVAVPGEFGEDEVLVVVAYRNPQAALAPEVLFKFVQPLLPHFALPRFVRQIDEFPMTPTGKVRKQTLREEGVTPSTWDRERAGIRVTRDFLIQPQESSGS
jgi:crotonobetaine/carnitine-CoA ligase